MQVTTEEYFDASKFCNFGIQKFCCILTWCFPSVLAVAAAADVYSIVATKAK